MERHATSLERRVLSGTGLQIAARIASALCSSSALVVLGRTLGDEGLGRFNWYFTLFLVVGALVDLGSMSIAVREATRHPEREPAVIRAIFRIRLVTVGVCIAICCGAAAWREGAVARALVPMAASLHLLTVAPNAAAAWLHARVRLTAVAFAPIVGFGAYLVVVVLLAQARVRDPWPYLAAFAGGLALQGLVPWFAARRHVTLRGPVDGALARELLVAMAPLGFSAAVSTLYFRLDALLLTSLVGESANGRYARTFPLLSFAIALPAYLSAAILPALTRAAARGPGDLLAMTRRACAVLAAFALPAALISFSLGGPVLWILWARHHEAEPLASFVAANGDLIACLPPLAIAGVAIFLAYPQMHALTAMGRQRVLSGIALVALLFKLAASSLLIRRFGVTGAAIGTACTECAVLLWVTLELRRATGASALSSQLARPLVAALPAGAIAWLLRDLAPYGALAAAFGLVALGVVLAGAFPLRLGSDR